MELLFVLSKENIPLARTEVVRLYKPKKYVLDKHFILLSTHAQQYQRLAYTQDIYEVLVSSKKGNVAKTVENYSWHFLSGKTFAVQSHCSIDEKSIASILWRNIKNPTVDLRNPDALISVFSINKKIILARKIWKNKKEFLQRKAHFKPALHPSSLDPRLARAMINLSGKTSGIIVDPFCGSAGILIEALFLGFSVVGVDNDKEMLERAETNIKHYGFQKKYALHHQDALLYRKKCAAVVTDLPYGKNTKAVNHEKLYSNFLQHYEGLTKTMVVGFPDFVAVEKLIKKTNWNIQHSFTYYLHKSLSKNICILEQNS